MPASSPLAARSRRTDDADSSSGAAANLFIVYGMPRTGTTYLYHALADHPQIFVPYRKESMFFSVNYDKGLEWYEALFAGRRTDEIAADINPMYFMDDRSLRRVLDYNPAVKVILGVREPVDFAISLYGNMLAHGHKPPAIGSAMRGFEWPLTPQHTLRVCLQDAFISRRIEELCEVFGERLLIYDFKHFNHSPLPVLKAIEAFLGLSAYFTESNYKKTKINASGRRNILGINRLLADQRILETAYRILPDFAIRKIRAGLEHLSAAAVDRPAARPGRRDLKDEELQALRDLLADDRRFYRDLFGSNPIVSGSDVVRRPRPGGQNGAGQVSQPAHAAGQRADANGREGA